MSYLLFSLLAVLSCHSNVGPPVNKPLASHTVRGDITFEHTRSAIMRYADENHFAVQVGTAQPHSPVMFSFRLFRDDVSVIVTRLKEGVTLVAAYPLCACELGNRIGLQEAAESASAGLTRELSR